MADISDLVLDSKLEAHFPGESTTEVIHTFQESDSTSGRRLAPRSERWKREKRIGGGGSGSVWLERCIEYSRIGAAVKIDAVRAVKQIDMNTRLGSIDYNRELEAIAKFSNDRYQRWFVQSFGWYEGPSQLFIAMEYLEQGDLFTYLYSKPPLPEMEVAEIIYQILEGLAIMHENKFAHRDLKPQNILIKSHPPGDYGWWVKVADFGITKRIGEAHGQSTTTRGTPRYSAPEIWGFVERGSPYARDVWALGEIMFEMSTKKPVFANPGLLQKYTTNSQKFPRSLLTDIGISQVGIDFVVSLMRPGPNERVTVASALSSLWIESRPVSTPSSSAITRNKSNSKHIQGSTQSSDSVGILTEELASWNTRAFSTAQESDNHIRPSHTVGSNRVKPSHYTRTAVAQGGTSHFRGHKVERNASYPWGSNVAHDPPRPTVPRPRQDRLSYQSKSSGMEPLDGNPFSIISMTAVHFDDSYWDSGIDDLLGKGITLFKRDQFQNAEPILQQVFKELETVIGRTHDLTLHCLNMIGCCLFKLGRYKDAEIILQQAFEVQEELIKARLSAVLGEIHDLYLQSSPGAIMEYSISWLEYDEEEVSMFKRSQFFHMVGCCLLNLGRYKDAEIILCQALEAQENVLGSGHALTTISLELIQESLSRQAKPAWSEEHKEAEEAKETKEYEESLKEYQYSEAKAPKSKRSRLSRFFKPNRRIL